MQYYRREMPRLAEVEVWSVGENLSLGILDRDGQVEPVRIFGTNVLRGHWFSWFGNGVVGC